MVKHLGWLGLLAIAAPAWSQAGGAGKPVVKVGDVAVFSVNAKSDKRTSEETVTITAVDANQIKVSAVSPDRNPPESEGVFTPEWHVVQSNTTGTRYDPPILSFKFPLSVGSSWKSVFEATAKTGARSRGDLDFKVVGAEKLVTPAGEFDTYRIESGGWITGVSWQGSFRLAQTQWYAPAISRIVKTEYKDYRNGQLWTDTVTEVKSFKPAP